MNTIKELSEQKIKLNEIKKKFNDTIEERDSKIFRKFSIFNVCHEQLGGIALLSLFIFVGFPSGFLSLIIAVATFQYNPEFNSFFLMIFLFITIFSSVSGRLAYLGAQEDKFNTSIYEKYSYDIEKLREEYKTLNESYKEELLMLDFGFLNLSRKSLNSFKTIELDVINDLKEVLKDRGDYDIIETINRKNKINKMTRPVLTVV